MIKLKDKEHSYNNIDEENIAQKDVMNDVRYICKSCSLVNDLLKKGCDVMQLPNGDIVIAEVKAVTFHYSWNAKKEKLVRVHSGTRGKKGKSQNNYNQLNEDIEFQDDLEMA